MPKYDHKCNNCANEFIIETKIDERNISQICPECGINDSVKIVSQTQGFVLKGRGWAKDNYCSSKVVYTGTKEKLENGS